MSITKDQAQKNISDNLRRLRNELDLPRTQAAEYAGITEPTLLAYENYGVMPSAYNLMRLARYYGVTVDSMFEEDGRR